MIFGERFSQNSSPSTVDEKALEAASMTDEEPITKTVQPGIKLKSALRLILGKYDLTYMIKDEVLMITTKDNTVIWLLIKVNIIYC